MEDILMKLVSGESIWAVLSIFLLIYTIKGNEKRDEVQASREENYQQLLSNLSEKFSILTEIRDDIKNILKDNS